MNYEEKWIPSGHGDQVLSSDSRRVICVLPAYNEAKMQHDKNYVGSDLWKEAEFAISTARAERG